MSGGVMKVVGIIPARYASSRFPGKALADIGGKPMVVRVYEQAVQALAHVWVATDDERIVAVLEEAGIPYVRTETGLENGTVRCAQAIERLGLDVEYVLNIQGDEPFIAPDQLRELLRAIDKPTSKATSKTNASGIGEIDIVTLIKRIEDTYWLTSPNAVKVVIDRHQRALYFSRSVIPHPRLMSLEEAMTAHTYYKHIGLYLYRYAVLKALVKLPPAPLEDMEKLEQLRWLAHGYTIHVEQTQWQPVSIDTPEDLRKAIAFMQKQKKESS